MLKKIIIVALVFLIIMLIGGFLFLNYVYIPRNLKPMAVSLLENGLGKKVSIGQAYYFPLKGVMFSEIHIVNLDQSPFLDIAEASMNLLSFPKVKAGEFSAQTKLLITGIHFSQEQINLKGNSVIDINIRGKGKKELAYNGNVQWKNLQLSGIKPLCDVKNINGNISFTENSFSSDDINAVVSEEKLAMTIDGNYSQDSIDLKQYSLVYGRTTVSGQGRVYEFKNPQIKFLTEGAVNLNDLQKILCDISLPVISGETKFSATANGHLNDLTKLESEVQVTMPEGQLDKLKFSQLKVKAMLKEARVYLDSFNCDFYEGRISANGKANISDKTIPIELALSVKDTQLASLIKDFLAQDYGSGILNTQVNISGNVANITSIKGEGWCKVASAHLQAPSRFQGIASALGVGRLANIQIEKGSAAFLLNDGRVMTEDLLLVAQEATITGKGYANIDQDIDFEILIKLSPEFVQSTGGIGQLLAFAADESGVSIAKVKIYNKISSPKYKIVPLPVTDVIKDKIKQEFKEGFKGLLDQIINK